MISQSNGWNAQLPFVQRDAARNEDISSSIRSNAHGVPFFLSIRLVGSKVGALFLLTMIAVSRVEGIKFVQEWDRFQVFFGNGRWSSS